MPQKSLHFCNHPGCGELTRERFCQKHMAEHEERQRERFKKYDRERGSAQERGYDSKWQRYSKWFLKQPENQICRLHLPGCTMIATCVDHIDPPDGPKDPRFWDRLNHQAACSHCNSVKGHRKMIGTYDMMEDI